MKTFKKYSKSCIWSICSIIILLSQCKDQTKDISHPSPAKSAKDELNSFQTEPGMEIKLVASEPLVEDPVISLFDEQNRLWVVEMRGFMNDIDRGGEDQKTGRISILEDTDGDEEMDKKIVYADSLIMPRAIGLFKNGALICENKALWITQDTTGDWIADTKILLDSLYAKNGMPEHSDNGLWRGMDNWYYNVKSTFRYKLLGDTWIKDSTEFRGQWGLSHDDYGRLFYNYNWSQLHADLVPPNYFLRNKNFKPTTGIDHGVTLDRKVYPIRPTPAVNRGYVTGTLNKDSSLIEFTAACSPYVYRERLFPKEYYGNAFVCEPSGNLVKRNIIESSGITINGFDPHPGKEFISSTDERFRPVHIHSGPDGAIYITDMYRGLIQHGAYVTPYLRNKTIERNLVLPVHYGRIWKVRPKNSKSPKSKQISEYTTDELLSGLADSSGWKRDLVQRLLVEKKDSTISSKLSRFINETTNALAIIHALWALEGMNKLDKNKLIELLSHQNPYVFNTSLRLLEKFFYHDVELQSHIGLLIDSISTKADIIRALQIALSCDALEKNKANAIAAKILHQYISNPLIRDAVLSSSMDKEFDLLNALLDDTRFEAYSINTSIFFEALASAIIHKGNQDEIENLVSSISDTSQWSTKSILEGFKSASIAMVKPIRLKKTPGKTLIHLLSNFMEWPGHTIIANKSSKGVYSLSDQDKKVWSLGRQYYLSYCAGCHASNGQGIARMAPTLVGSDWVIGDKKRLALIVLHGLEGPIEVKQRVYDKPEILPVMPSHSTLGDDDITAILTYIRNEWGNTAGAMDRRTVGMTRVLAQGRVQPWTVNELNKYVETTRDTVNRSIK